MCVCVRVCVCMYVHYASTPFSHPQICFYFSFSSVIFNEKS